jgi:phosphomannomutase
VLLLDYIIRQRQAQGNLPPGGVVIKTIVTTELISKIAQAHELTVIGDVPVGIKYIADTMDHRLNGHPFIFAAEESHGYVYGTYGREKDSAAAGLLISEYAALLKAEGKTLFQQLEAIKRTYGYYREIQQSLYFTGMDGMTKMLKIMETVRGNPPAEIGGTPVHSILDQLTKQIIDPASRAIVGAYAGFTDNAMIFYLAPDANTRVVVRPSGTEPKIKFYVAVGRPVGADKSDEEYAEIKTTVDKIAHDLVASWIQIAEAISPGGQKSAILG